jgi:hypothetical protein
MIKQTLIRQPKTRIIHPSERERERKREFKTTLARCRESRRRRRRGGSTGGGAVEDVHRWSALYVEKGRRRWHCVEDGGHQW